MPHKKWCDLLSTTEAKNNRKKDAAQIKKLAVSKAAPVNSDSDTSAKVAYKNKASNGVLTTRKHKGKEKPKHKQSQRYCGMYDKARMPDCNYKSHSLENCIEKMSNQESIEEGLVCIQGNRDTAFKKYNR